MKKFLIILCAICISVFSFAQTETINWYMDGNVYTTTTCESGNDILLPTTPTKRGYTFKGWASYQLIEYLESTGTQYIDTGVKPTRNISAKYDCSLVNTINYDTHIFGSRETASKDAFDLAYMLGGNTDQGFRVLHGNEYAKENVPSLTPGQLCQKHSYYMSGTEFKIDNNIKLTYTTDVFNSKYDIWLFIVNNGGIGHTQVAYQKLYSCKIWDNDVLIRDFIPVLDKNGTPCMFDKVEGKFYYNAGTGQFIAGPVLNE